MTEYFYFWLNYHFNIRISYFNFILCPGLLFWFLWYLQKPFTLFIFSKFCKAMKMSMLTVSISFGFRVWMLSYICLQPHFQSTFGIICFLHHPGEKKKMVQYTTLPSQTTLWEHCIGRNAWCCANYVPTALSGPVSSTYLWVPTCRVQRVLCETEWALVVVGHWCGEK